MKIKYLITTVLVALTLAVSACAPAATPPPQAPATQAPAMTSAPATTAPSSGNSSSASAASTPAAMAPTGPATINVGNDSMYGSILTDDKGMALYIFLNDSPNTSNCSGSCASLWPPLMSLGAPVAGSGVDASKLSTITRTDGSTQVTYNGWPLYYYSKDTQAGKTLGQGIKNVWYVVSPAGDAVK